MNDIEGRLLPLTALPRETLHQVRIVCCDIDETLTNEGRLLAPAYQALERLADSGRLIIPVTGRPAGWCDMVVRQWPVAAVIGENGALAFVRQGRAIERLFWKSEGARKADHDRLAALAREICALVPGTAVAGDQPYRAVDFAIDHSEAVGPLGPDAVARIVAHFRAAGARAEMSSVHVNAWFGDYDKLKMTRRVLGDFFDLDVERDRQSLAYLGDAPNDAPMFAAFQNSIGVANVRAYLDRLSAQPRYVTEGAGGLGFAEFVAHLLG